MASQWQQPARLVAVAVAVFVAFAVAFAVAFLPLISYLLNSRANTFIPENHLRSSLLLPLLLLESLGCRLQAAARSAHNKAHVAQGNANYRQERGQQQQRAAHRPTARGNHVRAQTITAFHH